MEKLVHWLVFLAIVAAVIGWGYQLLTTGSFSAPPFSGAF